MRRARGRMGVTRGKKSKKDRKRLAEGARGEEEGWRERSAGWCATTGNTTNTTHQQHHHLRQHQSIRKWMN